jgi:hypothetical protein
LAKPSRVGFPSTFYKTEDTQLEHTALYPEKEHGGFLGGWFMADWTLAQVEASDALTRLHYFTMTKRQGDRGIEFLITVRESVPGADRSMQFLAQADKQTNQKSAPFTPTGWGSTLLEALSQCVREVHRFPYEGDD